MHDLKLFKLDASENSNIGKIIYTSATPAAAEKRSSAVVFIRVHLFTVKEVNSDAVSPWPEDDHTDQTSLIERKKRWKEGKKERRNRER